MNNDDISEPAADEPSALSVDGQNTAKTAEETATEPAIKSTAKPSGKTPSKRKAGGGIASKIVMTVMLLAALGAAGGVGWLFVFTQQDQQQLKAALARQQQQIDTLQTQWRQQSKAVENQDNQLKNELKNVGLVQSQVQARVGSVESQLSEMTGMHRIDWMLKEAEHFIVVAERRLSLLADVDGALALLIEADALVKEMKEPTTRSLREALTRDIDTLKLAASTHVDTEGLFARIGVVINKLQDLEQASLSFKAGEETLAVLPTVTEAPNDALGRFVYKLQAFAGTLVRIKQTDEIRLKPLLQEDQQAYLQQNLMALLEQAQLALLRSDYGSYRLSLTQAKQRITQYLSTDNRAAKRVLEELNALASLELGNKIPSLEASVRAVQVFREFWLQEKVQRELQKNLLKQQATTNDAA